MIYEKLRKRRSIRRFLKKSVSEALLRKCVDAARFAPSGMNLQPLKYVVVNEASLLKEVFQTLRWAGYLPDYQPDEGEMPRAYVIILLDSRIASKASQHDAGIAAASITMVAYDEGVGSCILGAVDRRKLKEILSLPEALDIVLVVALGYPAETPVVDEVEGGDVKYWLDSERTLHVPKRGFEDVVYWNLGQKQPQPS